MRETGNKKIKFHYSTVIHEIRGEIGTDANGFCLIDAIYRLSFNHINKTGWCFASKETLAGIIGVSRSTVFRYLKEFEMSGWIKRHNETGYLKTTDRYNSMYQELKGEEEKDEEQAQSQNETQSLTPLKSEEDNSSQNENIGVKLRPVQSHNDTAQSQNDTQNSLNLIPDNNKYNNRDTNSDKDKEVTGGLNVGIGGIGTKGGLISPEINEGPNIPSSLINNNTLNTDFDFDIPSTENIDADFDTLSPEEFKQKYLNPVVLAKSAIRFLKVRLEQTENELAHDPNNKRLLDDIRAYQDEIVKEKKKLDSFKSSMQTEKSEEVSRLV